MSSSAHDHPELGPPQLSEPADRVFASADDGRSTLMDASAHTPISTSHMITRSHGCSPAGAISPLNGEYAYQPDVSPVPRFTR